MISPKWYIRLLSILCDLIICCLGLFLIVYLIDDGSLGDRTKLFFENKITYDSLIVYLSDISTKRSLLIAILYLVYYMLFMIILPILTNGRTIFTWLFGLKMVKLNSSRMSFGTLFIRQVIGRLLFGIFTFGFSAIINILLIIFSKGQRSIPDRISNILVIKDPYRFKY